MGKIINYHPIAEKKICQARMLYPGKVCFKNEDELKTIPKAKTEIVNC